LLAERARRGRRRSFGQRVFAARGHERWRG
jgi:hypothetical protein